jgi:iron(III) transport system permease protein
MIEPAEGHGTRFRRLWERVATVQGVTTAVVLLGCGALVLYPVLFLIEESLNTGDPIVFPAQRFGFFNYLDLAHDLDVMRNTVLVAGLATALAVGFGFVLAWILSRTDVPGRRLLERLIELPYYVTPLVGALAWSILAGPKNGFLNQLWHLMGGRGDLFNSMSAFGIAWVMAFFEGTVAFLMISAAMKSMDPALEESARVLGGSKLRTMLRITLPLVTPAVLGATVFVFAEMLGAFAAALVLGIPARFYVITTAIYEMTFSYPPNYAKAAAMGIALFAVMFVTLSIYRRIVTRGVHTTITGKAFRPRVMAMRRWRWMLVGICWAYVFVAVILPLGALLLTSFQRFATVIFPESVFTLANYQTSLRMGPVRSALGNSVLLGVGVATVGVLIITVLVWIIYRSHAPGRGAMEYLLMFPQAVPRMVFGLALLWAWLNIPVHIYGTLWLLALAYFTVLLPLGVRTMGGVVLQIDRSLEECARMCGASWAYQLRTVTVPLLRPGIVATWLLFFMASVRELGASIFLMGPNSKVIAPSIVSSWMTSGTELTAAMAIIQSATVLVALVILLCSTRAISGERQW